MCVHLVNVCVALVTYCVMLYDLDLLVLLCLCVFVGVLFMCVFFVIYRVMVHRLFVCVCLYAFCLCALFYYINVFVCVVCDLLNGVIRSAACLCVRVCVLACIDCGLLCVG